jgi:hypothetical protein
MKFVVWYKKSFLLGPDGLKIIALFIKLNKQSYNLGITDANDLDHISEHVRSTQQFLLFFQRNSYQYRYRYSKIVKLTVMYLIEKEVPFLE